MRIHAALLLAAVVAAASLAPAATARRGSGGADDSIWSGAGAFVWNEGNADPKALGQNLRANGFRWAAVILHDGTGVDPLESAWIERFRAAAGPGIALGGWGVLRDRPEAEATLAAQLVDRYDLDFYIANAEAEYKYSGDDGYSGERYGRSRRFVEAFRARASDIHLEPLPKRFRLRYRIDGMLHEIKSPPKRLQAAIIARLKIQSNMSIAEHRIPQDGRIQVKMGKRAIDLRVNSIPTVHGESIVMRILDKSGSLLPLDKIIVQDYDAIVTDIRMPGTDGLALLAEILGRRPGTPTLMITGHGEYDLPVRALRGGAYDFIQKPIERDRFVASLQRAIRARASQRRLKDRRLALERCAIELEKIAEKLGHEEARVLIVDDDPALLQALPETPRLRMSGITVDTADSAAAALDRIAVHDYDAIVTDIKMPGLDGLGLLAEIRKRRPDTPTLMLTGHGEQDLAVRALRGGAYDFIQKPIDRDHFAALLYRAIRVHALNRRQKKRRLALGRCVNELERIVVKLGGELRPASGTEER